jgi:hypothetical protein
MSYSVLCGDFGAYQDPDEEWLVPGFATPAAAQEYARRFIRAQIEHLRADAPEPTALRDAYFTFGEYATTEGLDTQAWVAHCIANPAASPRDTNYESLTP